MIDIDKKRERELSKERQRRRMHVTIDADNYEYTPADKQTDYYDNDVHQRVAIYVRVSTDDERQTTSFELQQIYYEDFVARHPNWTLVKIYADEGISGTSLKHRDEFNRMIADCRAGKIDLIITKSVSRFARNVMITIGVTRDLAEMNPPIGVFFESEAIFSLKDDSQSALTFLATMAEEESHTRRRS
ncbi:MAG: recombinase family protein, partial [Clostridia bacterium]|nr:recombinase family protein [Clostridia bacterium]